MEMSHPKTSFQMSKLKDGLWIQDKTTGWWRRANWTQHRCILRRVHGSSLNKIPVVWTEDWVNRGINHGSTQRIKSQNGWLGGECKADRWMDMLKRNMDEFWPSTHGRSWAGESMDYSMASSLMQVIGINEWRDKVLWDELGRDTTWL